MWSSKAIACAKAVARMLRHLRFPAWLKPAQLKYAFIHTQGNGEYLSQNYFARAVLAAIGLHLLALYIWHISPRTQVMDIPVRALNIKLGDIDMSGGVGMGFVRPGTGNSKEVEKTLSKLVEGVKLRGDRDEAPSAKNTSIPKARSEKMEKPGKSPAHSANAAAPRQFIRNSHNVVPAQEIIAGDSLATHAEIMRRYEQIISQWIQKFKLYPEEARTQNMEGETVVRIRIDRQGNIKYHALERSTGYQILDRAAIAMIRRANPVPAVPHDYPQGDRMEFLIPVTFHLN